MREIRIWGLSGEGRSCCGSCLGGLCRRGWYVHFFLLGADIPAFSRKGAREWSDGQLDLFRNTLRLGRLGIEVPLEVTGMGRHAQNVASFEDTREALVGQRSKQSVT